MIEDYDLIRSVLEESGTLVDFSMFSLWAIPSHHTSILHGETSLSIVEQQQYNFYVSTKDTLDNIVKEDMEFTYSDDSYLYTFAVSRDPIPELDGWSRIPAHLIMRDQI